MGQQPGAAYPKDQATRAGLRAGVRVEIAAEGDKIVITPAGQRYALADLLKGVTPEAVREAFDWGPEMGREIVE